MQAYKSQVVIDKDGSELVRKVHYISLDGRAFRCYSSCCGTLLLAGPENLRLVPMMAVPTNVFTDEELAKIPLSHMEPLLVFGPDRATFGVDGTPIRSAGSC